MNEPWREILNTLVDVYHLIIDVVLLYGDFVYGLFITKPEKDVTGRVVVITGAGHGLGREMALILATKGAQLALIDVHEVNVKKTREEVLKMGSPKAESYVVDIRNHLDVIPAMNKIRNSFGEIDILINNAGIVQCKPFEDLNPETIVKTFEVNTFSHFWTTKCVLQDFLIRGKGQIVAISSVCGVMGTGNLTDYCASKHAIIGFMKALDREIHSTQGKNNGIILTTINPLIISTGMFHNMKSRFDSVFPITTPKEMALMAVHAVLTDAREEIIPPVGGWFHSISQFTPRLVRDRVQDFFQYGVDPHTQ